MLIERLLFEDHLVAVDVEHAGRQDVIPHCKLVERVARLALDPILELLECLGNDLVLPLHGHFFAR